MLEDDYTWVIRKALRGHDLSPSEAAVRAGLPENEVLAFTRGNFSPEIARKLAPVLGLNPGALATHPDYHPTERRLQPASFQRLELPYGQEHVNAWLVSKNGAHLLFDTGDDKTSCADKLNELGVSKLDAIFITHHHADHTAGLPALTDRADQIFEYPIPGSSIQIGDLTIETLDLSGHATPAIGYLIHRLETPILIPGDAIFAGSIGGCQTPSLYQKALRNLNLALDGLPGETILLPGHGPATTLGEERARNPFL